MSAGVVYVVDDEEPIRKALALLFRSAQMETKMCASAQAFLCAHDATRPGCLVLDIRMPEMSGLQLQEQLLAQGNPIPIIFMTANGDIPTAVQAMQGGARDFVEKPFENEKLLEKVRFHLGNEIRRWPERATQASIKQRLATLTQREREVMTLLTQGMQNKQIAQHCNISTRTVESHRAKIMHKLQLKSLSQLVQLPFNG